MTIKNAVIDYAQLTIADHGLLSGWIGLDYGGTHQGFGGHALYLPKSFTHHGGPNFAGHWIYRVIEIAGVEKWENLKGKTVRVKLDNDRLDGRILAIGHIIKDDWFSPEDDFAALKLKRDEEIIND